MSYYTSQVGMSTLQFNMSAPAMSATALLLFYHGSRSEEWWGEQYWMQVG